MHNKKSFKLNRNGFSIGPYIDEISNAQLNKSGPCLAIVVMVKPFL